MTAATLTAPTAKVERRAVGAERRNAPMSSSSPGPVRRRLIRRVRAEIAAGGYDTAPKLEAAAERLLAALAAATAPTASSA